MSPGIITKPDSEVLDLQRLLLADLLNRDNLASGLLELPQLPQEVPEPGLGHNLVRGEDPHPANTRIDEAGSNQAKDRRSVAAKRVSPVQGSDGLRLGGHLSADHPVLLQGSLSLHFAF